MDLAASLLTFTMFWKLSCGLQCYKCHPEHTSNACTKFDYSDKYLVECENSSMCFKRVTTLEFGSGLISQSIQRGCAHQTMSGEQKKVNGKWQAVYDIHEVYEEACSEDPSNSERSTKTLHCYCRGDRCNSAHTIILSSLVLSVIALVFCALS